jgi:hypothetical protein
MLTPRERRARAALLALLVQPWSVRTLVRLAAAAKAAAEATAAAQRAALADLPAWAAPLLRAARRAQ